MQHRRCMDVRQFTINHYCIVFELPAILGQGIKENQVIQPSYAD